ncbi:MAG: Type I restriction-modification system, restriction subunit R (EC [uncultured Sulfurovum sp.]|uniref:Type I restriction-modification system, restriction subunit R (EC) n=1 Tax=uncultured Sulfurovum sp. TaxID=269237 RepID=A0A6S6U7S1_9BACT|nr:MAG: Type I restriction-modification system, restriction subunit R (EC [uncultured Sulfurovum sp.]
MNLFNNKKLKEIGLQQTIIDWLVEEGGYEERKSKEFDKEFCVLEKPLLEFLKATQLEVYNSIQEKGTVPFLQIVDRALKKDGIIKVLRFGVKYRNFQVKIFYPEPSSKQNTRSVKRYQANIFTAVQELKYSTRYENRIDVSLFLNGYPIVTMELKNEYSGQNVWDAIKQYKETRLPSDELFRFGRCMVHFAVDTQEVYMTTELKGDGTFFFPFNRGLNDGKPYPPYGKGNPQLEKGIQTQYLWQEIFRSQSLSNIIQKFAAIVESKDKKTGKKKRTFFFPRLHQLMVVRKVLKHTKEHGVGNRYLIQHSAGSGKSNSITWLALQLMSLQGDANEKPFFDSVIVITDRTVLDVQLRNNIKQFAGKQKGLVAAITGKGGSSKTRELKEALENKTKIIIVTIQTFPFVLKELDNLMEANFAILIDEAHSSQSGDTSTKMNAVLSNKGLVTLDEADEDEEPSTEDVVNHIIASRRMLTNACYYAFTATPKNKTLEVFGRKGEDGQFYPFHSYSMKQAIEEQFIMDVLQNYTTYKVYYKLSKKIEANPDFSVKQSSKFLRSYVHGHEMVVKEKARIMIDHFLRDVKHRINYKAKAMIVTKSIEVAMKYKDAFDTYLNEIHSPYKAIVAFSGSKPHPRTRTLMTEADMNDFPDGKNDIPEQFEKDEYRFLIVANKFQTGFDQPLLHTMYVDKKLSGVQAVQTLSRLNRSAPNKKDTFVLDFYNATDDIKAAFEPYYTTTILAEETNVEKLNELQEVIEDFEVFDVVDVDTFFYLKAKDASRNDQEPLIKKALKSFNDDLDVEQKVEFKSACKNFLRTYSYLSKIMDFENPSWEKLWWNLKYLVPLLKIKTTKGDNSILDAIEIGEIRPIKKGTQNIQLANEDGVLYGIPSDMAGMTMDEIFDTLENIIKAFNQRFGNIEWGEAVDSKEAQNFIANSLPEKIRQDEDALYSIKNSDKQNAKVTSDKKAQEVINAMMLTHIGIYKKIMTDPELKNRIFEFVFDILRRA